MTPEQFGHWRKHINLSQAEAGEKLRLPTGAVELYEGGTRKDANRPVEIPRSVDLVCAALAAGIESYSGPAEAEPQGFNLDLSHSLIAPDTLRLDVEDFIREMISDPVFLSEDGIATFPSERDAILFELAWRGVD